MWWRRRNRTEGREPVAEETYGTDLAEAREARRLSEAALRHAQARDPSVREVGRSLRDLRTKNGFAADWQAAMGRRGTHTQ